MNTTQVAGLINKALAMGGTWLVANGLTTTADINHVTSAASPAETIMGFVPIAASIAWTLYIHSKSATIERAKAMQNAPVPSRPGMSQF